MEKSLNLSKLVDENRSSFSCNECGLTFQKPILATVSSSSHTQRYYACPHCLAKVKPVKERKGIKRKKTLKPLEPSTKKDMVKLEENMNCKHFLGYLKQRPKNSPIPEECLTCSRMIKCLLH